MTAPKTAVGTATTPGVNTDLDAMAASIAAGGPALAAEIIRATAAEAAAQATANTALANAATAQATADSANTEMGALVNILTPATGGLQGRHTVAAAGTAEQIGAGSVPIRSITITAFAANTGKIAWGFSNAVKATVGAEAGAQLGAGESITVAVSDVNKLWFDASVNGEGFSYTYIN